ncbi:MAG: hypothetical protein H6727_08835 [Myxococcales bacterium]|nr:hypothetical protein [Myxococcales bacterium]
MNRWMKCLMILGVLVYAFPAQANKLYSVKANEVKIKAGSKGQASFSIVLGKGAKVHPQAPFRCSVSASAGLAVEKKKLGHKDKQILKEKHLVRVPVGISAKSAGKQHVDMGCSFYICTKDICARKDAKVKIPVVVAAH